MHAGESVTVTIMDSYVVYCFDAGSAICRSKGRTNDRKWNGELKKFFLVKRELVVECRTVHPVV